MADEATVQPNAAEPATPSSTPEGGQPQGGSVAGPQAEGNRADPGSQAGTEPKGQPQPSDVTQRLQRGGRGVNEPLYQTRYQEELKKRQDLEAKLQALEAKPAGPPAQEQPPAETETQQEEPAMRPVPMTQRQAWMAHPRVQEVVQWCNQQMSSHYQDTFGAYGFPLALDDAEAMGFDPRIVNGLRQLLRLPGREAARPQGPVLDENAQYAIARKAVEDHDRFTEALVTDMDRVRANFEIEGQPNFLDTVVQANGQRLTLADAVRQYAKNTGETNVIRILADLVPGEYDAAKERVAEARVMERSRQAQLSGQLVPNMFGTRPERPIVVQTRGTQEAQRIGLPLVPRTS